MAKKNILIFHLFFCFILISQIVSPQNKSIESLIESLPSKQGKDKIDACSELSNQYFRVDPIKGLFYGRLGLRMADSLNLQDLKAKLYNNIGLNYFALSKNDSALIALRKAMYFGNLYKDTLELANANSRIGVLFEKTGQFDSAIIVFKQALSLFSRLGNCHKIGMMNENIGTIHLHRGEKKSALINFLRAESMYDSCGLKNPLSSIYLKIGVVYAETGELNLAEKWYLKGKELAAEMKDFDNQGIAINAIGILLKNQGKNEEALEIYMELIPFVDKINNLNLLQAVYGNIANVYQNLKEYTKSVEYNKKALEIAEKLNNPILKAQRYVGMGDAYLGLNNFDNALYYLGLAIPVLESSKAQSNLLAAYNSMIKATKAAGRYETALIYYDKVINLKDSLNRNELNSALDSLKVKFNTEKTLKDNAILLQQTKAHEKTIFLQKTILLLGLLLNLLLVGFVAYIIHNRKKLKKNNILLEQKNEEIRSKAEELANKNKQLMEFSQYKDNINSFLVHDLKNPLNSIINIEKDVLKPMQVENIRQTGRQMLNIVSNLLDISKLEKKMMRLLLEDKPLSSVVHKAFQEITYLANKKSIKIRVEFGRDYFVKIDEEIIKRVFVNLLTNAIKFSKAGGLVRISAEICNDSKIRISVQDEGEGILPEFLPFVFDEFSQAVPRKLGSSVSTGIGLTFCKLAVEAHGGTIGVISEKEKGTTFWFTLPFSEKIHDHVKDEIWSSIGFETTETLAMTQEEMRYLKPFCESLKKIDVSRITEVKNIVKNIEGDSDNISLWKSLTLQALAECNELKFQELINIAYDESL